MKRGGGRTGAGGRKRPARAAPAGANLIGKRILVLQAPPGADPEWHIGTIVDWLGVRHVANLTPYAFPVCSTTGSNVQKKRRPHASGLWVSPMRGHPEQSQPGWKCIH